MCGNNCTGACKCKSPKKIIDERPAMYSNGNGVSFPALTVAKVLTVTMFSGATMFEDTETGELVIKTGLIRGKQRTPELTTTSGCVQPCNGVCESCPAG